MHYQILFFLPLQKQHKKTLKKYKKFYRSYNVDYLHIIVFSIKNLKKILIFLAKKFGGLKILLTFALAKRNAGFV